MLRSGGTTLRAQRAKSAIFLAVILSLIVPATATADDPAPPADGDAAVALVLDEGAFDAPFVPAESLEDRELDEGEVADPSDPQDVRNLTIDELLPVPGDEPQPGTSLGGDDPDAPLPAPPTPPNIPAGRVAGAAVIYDFSEGSGTTVEDESGLSPALDLEIATPARSDWRTGGLFVDGTALTTGDDAKRVINTAKNTNMITFEAWVTPIGGTSTPENVVQLGTSTANRRGGISAGWRGGDPADRWEGSIRTRTKNLRMLAQRGSVNNGLTHLVATRNLDGSVSLYVNGVRTTQRPSTDSFSNWKDNLPITVAADGNGGRPFAGTLHLVAIYTRGLTEFEVGQNFAAGPGGGVTASGPDTIRPIVAGPVTVPGARNIDLAVTTNEPTRVEVRVRGPRLNRVERSGPNLTTQHQIEIDQLRPEQSYRLTVFATDAAGNRRVVSQKVRTNEAGRVDTNFNLWYGGNQKFGNIGQPQRWVNVLGSISDPDGIAAASYRLNGGVPMQLGLGPDDRRLVRTNDFNIEMLNTDLRVGNNVIDILAIDTNGNTAVTQMTVNWTNTATWPLPYSIDWSSVNDIQDSIYVLDGHWKVDKAKDAVVITGNDAGYDRLALIGELAWTDYEIRTKVKAIDKTPNPSPRSSQHGFGFIVHWNGHNESVDPGSQPRSGFLPDASGDPTPFGAILWWRQGRLRIMDESATYVAAAPREFSVLRNGDYELRAEVSTDGAKVTYKLKIWKVGDAEPADWGVEWTSPGGGDEPGSGSLALLAHEMELEFGDITVTPVAPVVPTP